MATPPEIVYLASHVTMISAQISTINNESAQISTINNKSADITQLYRNIVDLSQYNPSYITTSIIGLEPL